MSVIESTRIPLCTAARLMGVGVQYLRVMLQAGKYDFGEVVSTKDDAKRVSYRINPRKFAESEKIPYETVIAEALKDIKPRKRKEA